MATEEAGTATYHATVTVVDDADPPVAASFAAGIEDLTDRTAFLKGETDDWGTAKASLQALVPGFYDQYKITYSGESLIAYDEGANTGGPAFSAIVSVTEPSLEWVLVGLTPGIPSGAYILGITLYVEGSGWATVPTVNAVLELVDYNVVTQATATLATVTDAPADVAAMNTYRPIVLTPGAPIAIMEGRQYVLRIVSPSGGTNASPATRSIVYRYAVVSVGPLP